jgi:hypothetical protein
VLAIKRIRYQYLHRFFCRVPYEESRRGDVHVSEPMNVKEPNADRLHYKYLNEHPDEAY